MSSFASLHINFAPRTVKTMLYSAPLWALAAALLGLGLIVFSLYSIYTISDKNQALDDAIVRAEKIQKNSRPQFAKEIVIPEARALMINAAIQQLNLPWSDMFDAIEAATPANIALVSIEPDPKKQLIKGAAEALTSDDMITYIERLKKQPLFADVVLVKHEVNQQDPYKPYRFEFQAQWKDGTP